MKSQPGTVSIGSLFGIDIELHWTFVMFLLLFLFLGSFAFISIVLLFVCVLIHELAHSITAQRNNVKVRRIILLPIGGASMIESHNIAPDIEFRISIVGPFMSLLLASIFGVLVTLTPPGLLTEMVQFLFVINLLLGIFNLLPAFPLDGGRAFRSWLRKKHTFFDATMLAVKANKYIIGLFVIGTFAYAVFADGSLSYKFFLILWNMIIIMFLYNGAQGEAQAAIIKEETKGMSIKDAMTTHFMLANPSEPIAEVYRRMRERKEGIVVMHINSKYYMLDLLANRRMAKAINSVADVATELPMLSPKMSAYDAIAKLETNDAGIGAVVQNGKLLGVASIAHIQTLISMHRLSMSPKPLKDSQSYNR